MNTISNDLATKVSNIETVDDATNILMQLPRGHALVIANETHRRAFFMRPDGQPFVSMIVEDSERPFGFRPARWFVFQEYIRYALETHTSCTISYPPDPIS